MTERRINYFGEGSLSATLGAAARRRPRLASINLDLSKYTKCFQTMERPLECDALAEV